MKMMNNEVNFVSPAIEPRDLELFGMADENIVLEDHWILAHVMHVAGLFPSVSEARRNGWDKPIPPGFSEFTIGKLKKKVWILNDFNDLNTRYMNDFS